MKVTIIHRRFASVKALTQLCNEIIADDEVRHIVDEPARR